MKILFIAAEAAPFVKVGGLADVVGALPKALARLGHDVRVVCPLYGGIRRHGHWQALLSPLAVQVGTHDHFCRVWEARLPGPSPLFYFLEYEDYFGRWEVYDGPWGPHGDNDRRYIFLSRGGLDLCLALPWIPDVVHGHDWSAALPPVFLNSVEANGQLARCASLLTIHNLQHQGYCHRDLLRFARLPDYLFSPDHLEAMGAVNLLKGGLFHATKITTVSPTYAREIQSAPGGCGLEALLKFRAGDMVGILNGIDEDVWNPARDHHLPARFDRRNLAGKAVCKAHIQNRLGLALDPHVPLFSAISRLYEQKGLDLLDAIIPRLMDRHSLQLVILGTGDPGLEGAFHYWAGRYPGRLAVVTAFDEPLSHQLYAASDFFVMPSRFEPCGLGQMYAMCYGAIPVARATGGLLDTVLPFRPGEPNDSTGFLFPDPSPDSFYEAVGQAATVWSLDPSLCRTMQNNGMERDFSWNASAQRYVEIYRWAIEARCGASLAAG